MSDKQIFELTERLHDVIEEVGEGMDVITVIGILETIKMVLIQVSKGTNDYYN